MVTKLVLFYICHTQAVEYDFGMEIKIHNPDPPKALLEKLPTVRLNYSSPRDLLHLVWLGDSRYCGVFGDGGNGAYEWFYWDGTNLEHSDVGYGGTDVALRDVLVEVVR